MEKPSSNRWLHPKFLPVILIFCLGLIIYSQTLSYPFHFDDETSIVKNINIRNLFNLSAIWGFGPTHFITHLSLALNYHFHQLNVFGYHVFNLLVHFGAAMLVRWLVLLTLATPAIKEQKISRHRNLIALLAGLAFVAHPIQTQGVTYIIQRAASLAALFYLATLALYAKSRLLKEEDPQTKKHRHYYAAALLAAVLAMFSKETAVTLPAMILLYEFCFFRMNKVIRWEPIIPFLLTLPIVPVIRFLTKPVFFTREGIQMPDLLPTLSGWQYLLTQFKVLVTYIRLTFLPLNQNLDYDYPVAQGLTQPSVLASLALLILIFIIAIRIFQKHRLISFGIFWFFLTLMPESSIIPIADVIYEHRLYLAMPGYCIFLVSAVYYLFARKSLKPMVATLLITIAVYSILAYKRNFVWKDDLSLWSDALRKSPHKARPYNNRGLAYQVKGDFDFALADYNRAIELSPNLGIAYINRGNTYVYKGDLDRALCDYSQAIQINPKTVEVYYSRGLIYKIKGNLTQAISNFDQAIQIDPKYAEVYCDRGIVYASQGNLRQALSDFNQAIKIRPKYAEAYNNRGAAYFFKKDYDKSWQDILKAQQLGYKVNPQLLEKLQRASGRER